MIHGWFISVALSAAAGPPLSLADALDEAIQKNETPQVARESVTQARAARRRALAAWLPSVELSASYIRRRREARPNGAPLLLNDAVNGLLLVQSRLFDATQITDLSAAGIRTDQQEAAAEATIRTFGFEVADAYFLVLAAEGTAQAARQRVELAEQVEQETSERVQAGLASINDRSRVELETATARLALTEAENAERQARLALSFLLTRPVAEPLAPTEPLVVGTPDLETLFAEALNTRPDLEALRRELVAQKQDALEPWLRMVPFLDATGRFTLTNETGFIGEAFNWNIQLTATWSIYDGGLRYADAQEQASRLRVARLELERLKRRTRFEIQQAQTDRATRLATLEQAQRRLAVAEINYDEVDERFRNGLANSLEQSDAQVELFEARVGLQVARFELRLAELALLEAVGAPLPRAS